MIRPSKALALLLLVALPAGVRALPEDRNQEILFDGDRSVEYLDEGRTVFYGSPDEPAWVSQGSLRIEGLEIEMLRDDNGLLSVTATGNPARFQQQPRADQAVVHASARRIHFDNQAGKLNLDREVQLRQEGGFNVSAQRIDYDLNTRVLDSTRGEEEEGRVRMVIPPQTGNDEE